MSEDPLRNLKDPLLSTGPEKQMELFRACARAADGYSAGDVMAVAMNLVITAIRQTHTTRQQAELRYDELVARCKGVLVDHYDSGGRKRGIFPYDQVIFARTHVEPSRN